MKNYKFDDDVKAVVCGIDLKVSYSKIVLASLYIQRGAKWIVTNEDEFVNNNHYRLPGNGHIIAALENGLKKSDGDGLICEKIVTGKPNRAVVDIICQ